MARKAAKLMKRVEQGEIVLVVSSLVVAELIWVLKSFYRYSLAEIADAVIPLIAAEGVEVEERDVLIRAIELAQDKNVDFVDAFLAVQAARHEESVCSFDEDFKRLPVDWIRPE